MFFNLAIWAVFVKFYINKYYAFQLGGTTNEVTLMAKAYLKIDLEAGKEKAARDTLRKVSGVKSAEFVTGTHDLLALVEGSSYEEIVTKTLSEIRKVTGISKTVTDFVFEW
jgi:DNA-binding Lrp family transcriptional regulator